MNRHAITTYTRDAVSRLSNLRNAAVGGLVASPLFAMAEVPAELTTAKTDALAVAAALVGMVVAIWAALYIKKFFGGK